MTGILDRLNDAFVEKPPLLRTPKTIQVLLLRQTHDYSIFRTEETRELNTAVIPASTSDPSQVTRVVFLASKQKAPETRNFAATAKLYYRKHFPKEAEDSPMEDRMNCEIKDRLCRRCPRCILFGAVTTEGGSTRETGRWNIKHRIEYSSAFSIEPYELINDVLTFNAVTESTQSTGQALGSTENVAPLVNFPSVVTLNSVTKEEFILVVKNLLSTKSYGAEGRIKGDVVNYICGIVAGNEEVITSLEYALELSGLGLKDIISATTSIIKKYSESAAFKDALIVLDPQQVESLVDEVQEYEINSKFIKKAYDDANAFFNEAVKQSKEK